MEGWMEGDEERRGRKGVSERRNKFGNMEHTLVSRLCSYLKVYIAI